MFTSPSLRQRTNASAIHYGQILPFSQTCAYRLDNFSVVTQSRSHYSVAIFHIRRSILFGPSTCQPEDHSIKLEKYCNMFGQRSVVIAPACDRSVSARSTKQVSVSARTDCPGRTSSSPQFPSEFS